MSLSPRQSLATALESITDIARCAHRAGVTPREFANTQVVRPCPTIPFLRIYVAIQHDPLPSIPHKMPEKPSDFDFGFFSTGFRLKRAMNGHDEGQAAALMGFHSQTISRIERGDALLIGVVLKACIYLQVSPFGYLSVSNAPALSKASERPPKPRNVSRETSAIEPSPLDILLKTRANTLRRVETAERSLGRLEGTKNYPEAFDRHRRYLASLANLTLAIEAVRLAEEKEVRVLGH